MFRNPLATASGSVPPALLRRFLVRQDVAGVFGAGRIDRLVAFLDVLNDPVFVDDERGAVAITPLFIEDAILLHDRSLEVAQ